MLKSLSRERIAVIAILACGAVERFVWAMVRHIAPVSGESHNIAVSLARTGKFANPFGFPSGPTAHIGMLTPLPSAAIYWLFGAETPIAEYALVAWNIGLVSLGVWLCWRLACALDVQRAARVAAVALVALLPLQFNFETQKGRNWEVPLAVTLLLWILLRLAGADRTESVGARNMAITGAICGLLFIVSPPAGLSAMVAVALFHYLRLPPARWWIAPVSAALVAGSLSGFWALRNLRELGEPVALRDNLGLELAISNYPGAVHPNDPGIAYVTRLKQIHPIQLAAGTQAMRSAGGEIPYYRRMGQQARDWIAAHPRDFLMMCARRVREFFLPPRWFRSPYGTPVNFVGPRQLLTWASALAGLCTLIVMAARRRVYAYNLVAVLACSLPYALVQPTLRYRYLVSTLLIFLAFDGIGRLIVWLRGAPS